MPGLKERDRIRRSHPIAADELDHHPDIHVERYRNVRITTTTFATAKLSDAGVALAKRIDELAEPGDRP